MGTLKDFIRKTPLIRAWRFAKKKPPLKQMRFTGRKVAPLLYAED